VSGVNGKTEGKALDDISLKQRGESRLEQSRSEKGMGGFYLLARRINQSAVMEIRTGGKEMPSQLSEDHDRLT